MSAKTSFAIPPGFLVALFVLGGSPAAPGAFVAPGSPSASALSASEVKVSWTDTNRRENGYAVERSLSATGGFAEVVRLAKNATSFTDRNLAPETTFFYRVRAYGRKTNVGPYSITVSATTGDGGDPPPPPPPPGDSDGELIWAKSFGGPAFFDGVNVTAMKVWTDGNMLVTGSFTGTVNLGNGALTSQGDSDMFVAKFSGASGGVLWTKTFGGPGWQYGEDIAFDSKGDILITGIVTNGIDFGGGPLVASSMDAFVLKLSPTGNHLFSRLIGWTGSEGGVGIAADENDDIVVTGFFDTQFGGAVDFGGGSKLASAGKRDVFLASYDGESGQHRWSRRFGAAGVDCPSGLSVEGGCATVFGNYEGKVDFGGGMLSSAGQTDLFLAQYATATGAHLWSKRFGSSSYDYAEALASDPAGNLYLAGEFASTISFGGAALSNTGAADVFIAALSASGGHLWSRRFGTASGHAMTVHAIAADRSGNAFFTGTIIDAVDFGGGLLPMSSSQDPYVVKLSSSGAHLWSKRFPSPDGVYNHASAIATDTGGNAVVAGAFSGSSDIDVDGAAFANAGEFKNYSYDLFLAKFAP